MDIRKLLVSLAICLGAGGIGGFFTSQSVNGWYATLQKPFFNPPNWVFGPVWTVLYIMMGIALYLIWNQRWSRSTGNSPYILFATQLLLNVGWSATFFGFRSITGGMVVIVALWLAILATIQQVGKRSRVAARLLIPYLLWVSYACALNYSFWRLN